MFWVDASSNETANEGFVTIGRRCGQMEEDVDSIKTWLSGKDNWLLIIDNANDPNLNIAKFFPPGDRGSIMITTRILDFKKYHTQGFDKVDRMHTEDAITLLLKSAAIQDTQNMKMRALAGDIVKLLGYLALAIIQAGIVLQRQVCSFSGFPELYSQRRQGVLKSGRPLAREYQYTVCTTWEISIKKIQDMPDTHAKLALDIFMSFAFMNFEGIHESIFKKARENVDLGYWRSWDNFIRDIPFIKFMPSGHNQLLLVRALGLLAGHSLININEDRQISIHPLVHEWARDRMSKDEQRKYWLIAAATLAMSTNKWRNLAEYQQRRLLLPHVDFCLHYENGQLSSEGPNLKERLDVSRLFAGVYLENSQLDKASRILRATSTRLL